MQFLQRRFLTACVKSVCPCARTAQQKAGYSAVVPSVLGGRLRQVPAGSVGCARSRTGTKGLQISRSLLTIPDRTIAFWCMTVRGLEIDDMQNRQCLWPLNALTRNDTKPLFRFKSCRSDQFFFGFRSLASRLGTHFAARWPWFPLDHDANKGQAAVLTALQPVVPKETLFRPQSSQMPRKADAPNSPDRTD